MHAKKLLIINFRVISDRHCNLQGLLGIPRFDMGQFWFVATWGGGKKNSRVAPVRSPT